jgi:hypothetical protein
MHPASPKPLEKLALPRAHYGPICLRLLDAFIQYHHLPKDLIIPQGCKKPELILSHIFDAMLHTMSSERRQELIKEVQEYSNSPPPSIRW